MRQPASPRRLFAGIAFLNITLLSSSLLHAQEKPAYAIFSGEGKQVSYRKMIKKLSDADVVFFGELHNSSLAHWLELQVLKDMYETNANMILGMEMFEADNQVILDEYLKGLIDEKSLMNEAKVWDNYKTDYRPLVEFARKNDIQVVATNVPRRYANLVYRKGLSALDSLPVVSQKWMTPLPLEIDYTLPGYQAMMEGMGQHGSGTAQNLVSAQALKDATMAWFIRQRFSPGSLFYHVNGAYHTQDREGIITYLRKLDPGLRIITIHTTEQQDLNDLEPGTRDKGDFIICIPEDMTRTY